MGNLEEVYSALQKADAAGDTAAAKQLSDYIRTQSAATEQPQTTSHASDPSLYDQSDTLGKTAMRVGREGVRLIGQGLASMAGVPLPAELQPQNRSERLGTAVSGALGMAGTGIGAGRAMAQQGGRVVSGIGQVLEANPGNQVLGAAGGAAASNEVKEEGGGKGMQLAAAMIGVPATAAAGVVKGAARGLGAVGSTIITPARQRSVIAGNILNDAAENTVSARQNLKQATEIVPGSAPMTGEASKDPGLAFLQNRLQALDQSKFSARISAKNEARNALLDTVADGGAPAAIQQRIDARNAITSKLRDTAFQQAQGKEVNGQSVLDAIDTLKALPENKGESVQKAMDTIRRQMVDADGNPETNAKAIYAVRKEINRILEGKYVGADESVLRHAGGQLVRIKGAMDDAISEIAPSWKQYLSVYSRMSKPIDRAQAISDIRKQTSLAAPDITTGRDYLSQPKWKNVVSKNIDELSKTLAQPQISRLRMIASDLDRGAAASNSASVKVPGSDTAANMVAAGNMTVAHVLGRVLGSKGRELPPALAALTKPFSWALSYNDQKIRELIVDSMLDPKLAADLMRRGTPKAVESVADALLKNLQSGSTGSAEAAVSTATSD
jgi:hypothetical protein